MQQVTPIAGGGCKQAIQRYVHPRSEQSVAFGQKKAAKLQVAAEATMKLGLYAPGNAAVITTVLDVLGTLLQSV